MGIPVCSTFPPAPDFSSDFFSLPNQWDPISVGKSGYGFDKGSYVISSLPVPFQNTLKDFYDGDFNSVAEDINRALQNCEQETLFDIYDALKVASPEGREVCWFPIDRESPQGYVTALDCLLATFFDRDAYLKTEWKLVLELPSARPANIDRMCAEPGSVIYHDAASKLRLENARHLSTAHRLPPRLDFKTWAMMSSNPLIYSIGRAIPPTFPCDAANTCSEVARLGRPFLPRSFDNYKDVIENIFYEDHPFCITFDGAAGLPAYYWIDTELTSED